MHNNSKFQLISEHLRAAYITSLADEELDRLAILVRDAIDELSDEPQAGYHPDLFPLQPDYSADMGETRLGTILSLTARSTMEDWIDGDEAERAAIDRRLQRQHDDTLRRELDWENNHIHD